MEEVINIAKQFHKVTATKLQALSYGVAAIAIVSKGKAVKNTQYKSDWKKNRYPINSCTLSNKQRRLCFKEEQLLRGYYELQSLK